MDLIWAGLGQAIELLSGFDPAVWGAAWRSLWISTLAVSIAALLGLPFSSFLALSSFPGRIVFVLAMRAGMAVPTVFVGLVCYSLFSRRGPLGSADLLYSPWAIVIGEFFLAFPIIVAITHGALVSLDLRLPESLRTLNVKPLWRWRIYLSEARVAIGLALLTAYARCVTELGVAMMVGGNLKERTRTLSTATALESSRGEFARGIAMGVLLLLISFGVALIIAVMSRQEED